MEELILDSGEDLSGGFSFLHEITERSRNSGVQVGVPWAQNVYEYLFELPFDKELGLIFDGLEPFDSSDLQDYDIK